MYLSGGICGPCGLCANRGRCGLGALAQGRERDDERRRRDNGGNGGTSQEDRTAWARAIVRELYLELLGREPDYPAAQGFVDVLVQRRATEAWVRGQIMLSPEYKAKKKTQQQTRATTTTGAATTTTPAPTTAAPAPEGTIFGLPTWAVLGGGALLLLVMSRR